MSDYIDTREGWTEVDTVTAEQAHAGHTLWEFRDGESVRAWVREAPVPPLPTAPYTVIRATWEDVTTPIILDEHKEWHFVEEALSGVPHTATLLSWKPLSKPPAVTVDELLEEIRPWFFAGYTRNLDYWNSAINTTRRKYGAEEI